jgi:tetratricopeptide (TPR) repeat protein
MIDKLKESARKYEQSGQWRPAIDVYKRALREFEEAGEVVPDPSLYNRIGDLEMKDGESSAAVRAYEQAADLYTEQGFFNNAIALCGKILRINPGRTATYLRLAQLNARKNFVGEARRNLLEYIERMDALHHREEAFGAVRSFAGQFSANPDIRLMLVELLRDTARNRETRDNLQKLAEELEAKGDAAGARLTRERLQAMTAETGTEAVAPGGRDLIFLDVGLDRGSARGSATADPVEGLELDRPPADLEDSWRGEAAAGERLGLMEPMVDEVDAVIPDFAGTTPFPSEEGEALDVLDIDAFPRVESGGDRAVDGLTLVDDRIGAAGPRDRGPSVAGPFETLEEAAHAAAAEAPPDLVFLPVTPEGLPLEAPGVGEQDEAQLARDRARVLLEIGDRVGGTSALEDALKALEAGGRWEEALEVADELTRLEPEALFRYQKRVELAFRSGRREAMLDAYLNLADALLRAGGTEHALNVYQRVLEHDPGNRQAQSAVAMLSAPPEPAGPGGSFVDLGRLILDEPQARDTRIRVDQQAPIEDEDQAFLEALAQFKRGIEENLDAEDFQAHYDLGVAFKEMGLLDEAIAQFQKALRAPEGRLKTSEQLGIAFFEKARYAIAEAVLRRAVDSLPGGDEEKIGLLYWLGRAVEAQRRTDEALRCYERVLAVDIQFLDVGARVHHLSAEPR